MAFHDPARLCEAEHKPFKKSQFARIGMPIARDTGLGNDADVCRTAPTPSVRAPQPKAGGRTRGSRRRVFS